MAPKPTLEKVESRSEYNFHEEGVLLISTSGRCFGYKLNELMERILDNASGHEDYYVYTPHSDGFDLLNNATLDDKVIALENSVWLVEDLCFDRDELQLLNIIQSNVPPQAEVLVWKDPNKEETPEVDMNDIEESTHKIFAVETETSLRTAIHSYFARDCHPRRSKHCVDWKEKARHQQEMLI